VPRFAYEARDEGGRSVRGVGRAASELALDRQLGERHLTLIRAREERPSARHPRVSLRVLIDFCQHLATVVEAGIPLLEGLRDFQEERGSAIAWALENVADKVESGSQLSAAMADHPRVFPDLVRAVVAAGEESGNLDRVLRDLVAYLEWRDDLRRRVVTAVTYPALCVVALVGLCVLMVVVVLPAFIDIFIALDVELPLATRALIAAQGLAVSYGAPCLLVALVAGVLLWLWGRSEGAKLLWHGWLLRLPVVGNVLSMVELSRLSHNLGLLYSSGIPILRSLELLEPIVQNRVLRQAVSETRERVRRGDQLASAFARHALLPPMVLRMISLGESSGRLDASLEHVASYYDREIPAVIDKALTFFNAGVLVGLASVLVTVALGIFVPLYRMMGNINAA
jgi:type IV pilus assembly protein PilC